MVGELQVPEGAGGLSVSRASPDTEVCTEAKERYFQAMVGQGSFSPQPSPLRLPWGPLLYHQHPDGRLSSRQSVDALLFDEGVCPLFMEHQSGPCCGRKEGDIVLWADVQDQLETCEGIIARVVELGHSPNGRETRHPNVQASFSPPVVSLLSTQHALPTRGAQPIAVRYVTSFFPIQSFPVVFAPSCYTPEDAFPSLWNAVPALSFLLERPTLSREAVSITSFNSLPACSKSSVCPLLALERSFPGPASLAFSLSVFFPAGLPGLEAKTCSQP